MTRSVTVAVALAGLAACADRPPASTDVPAQIEDSAGVRIVEYAGVPEVEPPFAIAEEPVYRHGANPGDYEFQGINVGRLFPDGGAVVADRENSEVVVLSPDGTTHEVLARRGEGPGDRPEITWRLPDGTVTQIVRWRAEPVRLTEELLEPVEAYERMENQVSYSHLPDSRIEEFTREGMSWYYAMIGQPMPLYGSPFADADGNVWLPSYRLAYPEEGSPYTVISSDGEWLGQVQTPPRFRILDVAGGLVLGVLRDDMDVENVVVYGLVGG